MTLLCTDDVQYVNCCYTRGKRTLSGERGKATRSDPTFQLFSDEKSQTLLFRVVDILPEDMYSTTVKEHVDIYILKEGANTLKEGLDSIIDRITAEVNLDRGDRSPKDPKSTYDDSGLPLEIDSTEAWIKASHIQALFYPDNFVIETSRKKGSDFPRLNIDVEKYRSRLHIGVEVEWEKSDIASAASYIDIVIPWREAGHMLQALNSVITKVK